MVHNSELILKNICLSPTIHGFEFDFQLRMSINLTKYIGKCWREKVDAGTQIDRVCFGVVVCQ